MNQGRIWCVVNPTVGLPLLLGSVVATSFIVHACVMTHTTWMSSYWSGSWRNKTVTGAATTVGDATAPGAPAFAVTVTPVPGIPGQSETSFVVSLTANPAAKPIEAASDMTSISPGTSPPGALASAAPPAQ